MGIIALIAEPDATKCRRCGATLEQEPGAAHCRMCGRIFYRFDGKQAQAAYERASGMVAAPVFTRRENATRRFYTSSRDASS